MTNCILRTSLFRKFGKGMRARIPVCLLGVCRCGRPCGRRVHHILLILKIPQRVLCLLALSRNAPPRQPKGELNAPRAASTGRREKQRIDLVAGGVEFGRSIEIQKLRVIECVVGFEPKMQVNALIERDAPVQRHVPVLGYWQTQDSHACIAETVSRRSCKHFCRFRRVRINDCDACPLRTRTGQVGVVCS